MAELTVNDRNFQTEVLDEKTKPVLIDFWAVWCYPCKIQGPIIDEVAREIGNRVKIAKIEVDESPTTASKLNILSIPTLAIFKSGQMVWQGVGVHQKQAIIDELKKHL
ncbi:MAG: thioredoxin [Patescibacteria group bacterium]